MNEILFAQDNGSATISLDQLKATTAIGEFDGKMPKSVPKVHFELIDHCMDLAKTSGVDIELAPLVIRERYCKKKKDAVNNAPEQFIVNRMAAKIYMKDPMFPNTPDEMRMGIAFTYVYDSSMRGIQVAFGANVKACDNLTVFGGFQFSTNGNDKVPFDKGMELLSNWIRNYGESRNTYTSKVEELKAVTVKEDTVHRLIGSLYTNAVRYNAGENVIAPLNQSEVSEMIRHGFDVKSRKDEITAWDITNWGTQVLKPHTSDMTNLIASTAAFNDFVYNELVAV